jgi:Rrf2 family protein
MLQIKTKTDYGLLIMLELARHPEDFVPLSAIASKIGISSVYLAQLAQSLVKAGLIKSREGSRGGFCLVKTPNDINLLHIIEALEKGPELKCSINGQVCAHSASCSLPSIWSGVLTELKDVLRKKTLATLLN